MAIVKMNKFTLLTFESEKEKLLEKLQGNSEVEFINLQDQNVIEENEVLATLKKSDIDSETLIIEENVSKTKSALAFLKKYVASTGGLKALREGKQSLTLEELESNVMNSNWETVYSKVKEVEIELASLENEKTKLESELEILKPVATLDAPLGELKSTKSTTMFLGSISKQSKEAFINELNKEIPDLYMETVSENNQDTYIFMVVLNKDAELLDDLTKKFGYSAFQSKQTRIPSEVINDFTGTIKEIDSKKLEIKKMLSGFTKEKDILELSHEYYQNSLMRKEVNKNFLNTENTMIIQGWIPTKENSNLETLVKEVSEENYYIAFEAVEEKEIASVPIKLENKGPAAAFDSITEMYSLPMYDEIDPTPYLTPFYMIFFGIMVADFGYGLVLFIGSILALNFLNLEKSKRDFVKFFMWLSLATCVSGLIFGTAFGIDLEKTLGIGIINPGRDTNTLLMLSVGLGVIQILFGLFVKAYMLIRNKQYLFAFFDVGSWLMLLSGLAMLLTDGFLKTIGIALAIAGSVIIVLTQGRAEKTMGAKLGQGAYALYGVTNYVGDLVSYTRLMALGIAGGSIAAALNLIIGMMPEGIGSILIAPVIFILAHVFNMGLSLLGAYVHTARLQYVEFFSKFYEGGGRPFSPFKTVDNFISLKKNKIK
ncbi:V-type ATP synthase subunit I [uncultured Clostridium sp.]|jgi:V/A-type H+-transporting ATPase subunit I|uniref:V-type ATP synthase subunit I n=1 Tax=uncultured Clostridium sp. TaxID=59620 RepID=UPI00263137C9|nr:V-type ATP synthase subunit I [uncultured Clostridium sp.]